MILFWFVILAVLDIPSDNVPYDRLFSIALQVILMFFIVWIVFRITDVLVPSQHRGLKDIYSEIKRVNRRRKGTARKVTR
jgi:hypothetical protein